MGAGARRSADQHPDTFGEAVRWLGHEGEEIQSFGRGRGVNREAGSPLEIKLLFDSCLPITVDNVVNWQEPSLLTATAVEGHMLTSPVDMTKLRSDLWPNEKAAYRTVQPGRARGCRASRLLPINSRELDETADRVFRSADHP